MIEVNTINQNDRDEIYNFWIHYWKNKKLNYDINYLKLERMMTCFVFRNNGELAMISGIDDISEFIPNTTRILTRATTTNYKPKCWGEFLEEKFFSNVMAGFSVKWCLDNTPNNKIVVTTNKDSNISKIVKKVKTKWLRYQNITTIYGIEQIIWEVDINNCIEMTKKWCNKNYLNFDEIYKKL